MIPFSFRNKMNEIMIVIDPSQATPFPSVTLLFQNLDGDSLTYL